MESCARMRARETGGGLTAGIVRGGAGMKIGGGMGDGVGRGAGEGCVGGCGWG